MATRTLGRLQSASVNLADGRVVYVGPGQALPSGLAAGEEDRLASFGAFDDPPAPLTTEHVVQIAREVLPPSVTLSANPELEGDAFVSPPPQASAAPPSPVAQLAQASEPETTDRPARRPRG